MLFTQGGLLGTGTGKLGMPGGVGELGKLGAPGRLGTPGTPGPLGRLGGIVTPAGELPPWPIVTETEDGRGFGGLGVPSGEIVRFAWSGFSPDTALPDIPVGRDGVKGVPVEGGRQVLVVSGVEEAFPW